MGLVGSWGWLLGRGEGPVVSYMEGSRCCVKKCLPWTKNTMFTLLGRMVKECVNDNHNYMKFP